ncbi:MAG TPA: cupin domain-containing protein [Acidimicrobiales bacterium]|nr:cupin domain-containing protein [Acidimicrobiales bacterium]
MTVETEAKRTSPRVFTFMSEEVEQARGIEPGQRGVEFELPGTEELTARVKVYIEGGENEMHSHPLEDHIFACLAGTATFHIERDDNTCEVSANEAVLLPRGTRYWFTNTGEGNLVMMRLGSGPGARYRLDAAGKEMTSSGVTWKKNEGRVLA